MALYINLTDCLAQTIPRAYTSHTTLPALSLFRHTVEDGGIEVKIFLIDLIRQYARVVGNEVISHIGSPIRYRHICYQIDDRCHGAGVRNIEVLQSLHAARGKIAIPVETLVASTELVEAHRIVGKVAITTVGSGPQMLGNLGF